MPVRRPFPRTAPTWRTPPPPAALRCGSGGAASLCGCGARGAASAGDEAAGCGSACGGCSGHAHAEATPVPAQPAQAEPGALRSDLVAVRRRGAGTDIAPNA
ncbi:hypothetical protein Scinn_56800 [Streptomyces virginiae]|uniref:Biotin synthase BioB n=1 Tax=Streptomyces virginiae TaxID=1961 RepID=A0ABQ3NU00_STRVG|nr:hypothetical protein Scinn_56800 [Streptomyces virginiae]